MADIELIIKIAEEQKKMVDAIMELPPQVENDLISAIRYGIPLPKGHNFIDRNNAITSICQHYTTCERMKMLSFTPNIIKQEVADILMQEPTLTTDKEQEE